jgi:serine/threonine-protein kinase
VALSAGARLGSYEILTPIGAGGMGEVFRARDTKLDRDVAIKVLPEAFLADPERVNRFQREAKTLAALNHPNIATIHGLEEASAPTGSAPTVHALVMEFVDGPTLADRIAHGPMPLEEVLPIARQIALAIEAAHEQGIVHRDLKPANVKVRPNGAVKVLDFGLAKLQAGEAGEAGRAGRGSGGFTQSPTLTSPVATLAGTILGTAAYMAPEQARGKPVDKRADIWAFGCVLFEMLTGRRAFGGDEVSDTLAFIITKEVDWATLPATTPAAIRRVLRRCLEKDPAKRLHDIADARIEIDEASVKSDQAETSSAPMAIAAAAPSRHHWLSLIGGSLVSSAVAGAVVWTIVRPLPVPHPQQMRFAIVPPANQPLTTFGPDRDVAISADGTRIAYVAAVGGQRQLMVRAIDQIEAVPLRGITTARVPFFSPDGKWIGYFDGALELKKVSVTGGPSIAVCKVTAPPRGATWSADDTIVFATGDSTVGLVAVPAGGGDPKVLTRPDTAKGETNHLSPFALPGGRAVLFTIVATSSDPQVAVVDLKSGRQETVIRGGAHPVYAHSGHLVYAALGALRAVRFDPMKLKVLSDPVPVMDDVTMGRNAADFSVSSSGTLVYVPGSENAGNARTLAWIDRTGREEAIKTAPRGFLSVHLSPDDTRIAVSAAEQSNPDVWIVDLARGLTTRLTFDPGADTNPVWTPNGRWLTFRSTRGAAPNIFRRAADGTGEDERLTTSPNSQIPMAFSPDGSRLVFLEAVPKTGMDLFVMPSDGKGPAQPLVQTPFGDTNADLSPDGRWLVYQSNESGRNEVYVRPFPNTGSGGRWLVSSNGGTAPAWARTGTEIFYVEPGSSLMAVPVRTDPTFSPGTPTKVVDAGFFVTSPNRTYDVSRDGRRVLVIKNPQAERTGNLTPASMIVVVNWDQELKARLPNP